MLKKMRIVVPLPRGTKPRWAELRQAAEAAAQRLATESGARLVGQVRYVKRVELSAFGSVDPELHSIDKYVYEAQAEVEE